MSKLRDAATEYLQLRRNLGCKLRGPAAPFETLSTLPTREGCLHHDGVGAPLGTRATAGSASNLGFTSWNGAPFCHLAQRLRSTHRSTARWFVAPPFCAKATLYLQ